MPQSHLSAPHATRPHLQAENRNAKTIYTVNILNPDPLCLTKMQKIASYLQKVNNKSFLIKGSYNSTYTCYTLVYSSLYNVCNH